MMIMHVNMSIDCGRHAYIYIYICPLAAYGYSTLLIRHFRVSVSWSWDFANLVPGHWLKHYNYGTSVGVSPCACYSAAEPVNHISHKCVLYCVIIIYRHLILSLISIMCLEIINVGQEIEPGI